MCMPTRAAEQAEDGGLVSASVGQQRQGSMQIRNEEGGCMTVVVTILAVAFIASMVGVYLLFVGGILYEVSKSLRHRSQAASQRSPLELGIWAQHSPPPRDP